LAQRPFIESALIDGEGCALIAATGTAGPMNQFL
jgi:hypothetical protein